VNKRLMLVGVASMLVSLVACKDGANKEGGAGGGKDAPPAAGATGARADKVCDDYVAKLNACMDKDPTMKEHFRINMGGVSARQLVDGWKKVANGHDAILEAECTKATASLPPKCQ
jgi:hypothetical protein